jgi:hypothetical protein
VQRTDRGGGGIVGREGDLAALAAEGGGVVAVDADHLRVDEGRGVDLLFGRVELRILLRESHPRQQEEQGNDSGSHGPLPPAHAAATCVPSTATANAAFDSRGPGRAIVLSTPDEVDAAVRAVRELA